MEMSDAQFYNFVLANWLTAGAYILIPYHLRQIRLAAGNLGSLNARLFELFVVACGTHHAVHPIVMHIGGWYVWIGIFIDYNMAVISVWAYISARFDKAYVHAINRFVEKVVR